MAVEERVVIKVEVDADITTDLLVIERRIKALEDRFKGLDRRSRDVERSTARFDRSMGRTTRTVNRAHRAFTGFFKTLAKFSFIGMALEVGVLATALIGARLAMATGRVVAHGYQLALRGVAAAAAAVATAVSVAAAAVRQFSEAQLAPFVGGNQQAAVFLRSISAQTGGLLGRGEATALTGQLGRLGLTSTQASAALSQLYDITAGDTKGISSLVTGLATGTEGFSQALGGIGPQGAAIAKQIEGMDTGQLLRSLISGQLTPEAFKGFGDNLASTLIGTVKVEAFGLFNLFADLGAYLVEPFRKAFMEIAVIFRTFILNTSPLIREFGADQFAPSLISGMEKTARWLERLLKDNLPRLEGFSNRMSEIWRGTKDFFSDMADAMRPLEAGADVLLDVLGAAFGGFFGNNLLSGLNTLLVANADTFRDLGDAIGDFVRSLVTAGSGESLLGLVRGLTNLFDQVTTELVPPLTDIAGTLKDIALTAFPPILSILGQIADVMRFVADAIQVVFGAVPGGIDEAGLLMMAAMVGGGRGRSPGRIGALAAAGRGRIAGSGLGTAATGALTAMGLRGATGGFMSGRLMTNSLAKNGLLARTMTHPAMGRVGRLAGPTGLIGGGLIANSLGDAWARGDTSGFNLAQGAAGGAVIGSAFAPGVGTVIGAVIGLGVSYGIGWWRKNKRKENAREFADEVIDKLIGDTLKEVGQDLPTESASLRELLADEEALKEFLDRQHPDADVGEFRKSLEELLPELEAAEKQIADNLTRNLDILARNLRLTDEEALRLAEDLDINLRGAMIAIGDQWDAINAITPDFAGTTVGPEIIASSSFAAGERLADAWATLTAFETRLRDAGSIAAAGFTTTDFQDMFTARATVATTSVEHGGFGLDMALAFNEFYEYLRDVSTRFNIPELADLADEFQASEADLLLSEDYFGPIDDFLDARLRQHSGEPLNLLLMAIENLAMPPDVTQMPGDERAEYQRFLSMGGLPIDSSERGYVRAKALVEMTATVNPQAIIDMTISGVISPAALRDIEAHLRTNLPRLITESGFTGLPSTATENQIGAGSGRDNMERGAGGNEG